MISNLKYFNLIRFYYITMLRLLVTQLSLKPLELVYKYYSKQSVFHENRNHD